MGHRPVWFGWVGDPRESQAVGGGFEWMFYGGFLGVFMVTYWEYSEFDWKLMGFLILMWI